MRVDDKLALLFYVIEYRHFLGADDNQPLLFEGMKPTDKDVRLHTALKLTGRQGGVVDLNRTHGPKSNVQGPMSYVARSTLDFGL